jgi:hypothetical protein
MYHHLGCLESVLVQREQALKRFLQALRVPEDQRVPGLPEVLEVQ